MQIAQMCPRVIRTCPVSVWIRTFHIARWTVGEGSDTRKKLPLICSEDIPQRKVQ